MEHDRAGGQLAALQVREEAAELVRQHHALVADRIRGERGDVEVGVIAQLLFAAAAGQEQRQREAGIILANPASTNTCSMRGSVSRASWPQTLSSVGTSRQPATLQPTASTCACSCARRPAPRRRRAAGIPGRRRNARRWRCRLRWPAVSETHRGGAAAGRSHHRSGHRRQHRHGGSCAKARRWRYQPTGAMVDRRAGRPCQIHRHRARSAGRKALGGCGGHLYLDAYRVGGDTRPRSFPERIVRPPDASTRSQVAATPQYTVAGATERAGNPVPARGGTQPQRTPLMAPLASTSMFRRSPRNPSWPHHWA